MAPKRFFFTAFFSGLFLVFLFAFFNYSLDIYGLHQQEGSKNVRVFFNEGYSKYLMTYNYIPRNFNALLIGPSLSDNINPEGFDGIDLFNLSFMGARMNDMEVLTKSAIKDRNSNIRTVILSLNPYLTEAYSAQLSDLSETAYKESYGSYNLLKTYLIAIVRHFNIMPEKYPKNQFSYSGLNDYNKIFRVPDVRERIIKEAKKNNEPLKINEEALESLRSLKTFLGGKHIRFIVYYHPIPSEIYNSRKSDYIKFKQIVQNILGDEIEFYDFNTKKYNYFTTDVSNYIDHGHLSLSGQKELIRLIQEKMLKSMNQIN